MTLDMDGAQAQATLEASLRALLSEQPMRLERLSEHVRLCESFGQSIEAYRAWRFLCAQNPADPFAWTNATIAAWKARLSGEAVFCASQTLALNPLAPAYALDVLQTMAAAGPFSSALDQAGIAAVNRRYAALIAQEAATLEIAPREPQARPRPPGAGRLRLGYLWSFFGGGTEFCFPFHHDRGRFEVVAVMPDHLDCPKEKIGVDEVVVFPANDPRAANALIRRAKLDLLVVLDGRGGYAAVDILVETGLAPLQAYFGNFFASTYSGAVDALIGDRALIDALRGDGGGERRIAIAEPIMPVRNPFFVPGEGTEGAPPRPCRFRLGTTGNSYKLSSPFMDLAAALLRRIPDSSFYYASFHGHEDCALARRQLESRGVAPERIEFFPSGRGAYSTMINAIDAAIDSVPYNGHLSSYEFLSQGVPVWSLRGPRLTQRYGEMILGAVGLPHHVFDSAEALGDALAAGLEATSGAGREALRRRVVESRLGDPLRATRLMEAALEETLASA